MTWAARIPTLGGSRYPLASFVLDFVNNYYRGSGALGSSPSALPGYTFTRASTGYAEDTNGNLISFASGVPRITNKGVLIEEARTNLLLQSQDFSNAAWKVFAGAAKVGLAAITDPAGGGTAYEVSFGTTGGAIASASAVYQDGFSLSNSTAYTLTLYVRAKSGTTSVRLAQTSGGVTTGSSDISVTDTAWTRLSLTVTSAASATSPNISLRNNTAGNSGNVYVAFAQLEAGSFPTSYIPTTSSTVTRAADVFYYSGLSISASTFTIAGGGISNSTGKGYAGRIATISDVVNGDVLTIAVDDNQRSGVLSSAPGIALQGINAAPVVSAGQETIDAVRVSGTSVRGSANASAPGDATGTYSYSVTLTRLYVGDIVAAIRPMSGYVRRIAIYPFAASDAQLQSISSGNF